MNNIEKIYLKIISEDSNLSNKKEEDFDNVKVSYDPSDEYFKFKIKVNPSNLFDGWITPYGNDKEVVINRANEWVKHLKETALNIENAINWLKEENLK